MSVVVKTDTAKESNLQEAVQVPEEPTETENQNIHVDKSLQRWSPSGSSWKNFKHFCGPGWFVAVAYLDPGNTQADINAGATAGYNLLWTIFWATIFSLYAQVLCTRLALVAQTTLAEAQRPNRLRYFNWFVAEFSVVITDLPEVIGFGIALNVLFGLPYYVGVLISPITTLVFLWSQNIGGMRILEAFIVFFLTVMGIVLFVEMGLVGVDGKALVQGWIYGFVEPNGHDLFSISGIIGCVVMPHNLYLHSASIMSRPVVREEKTVKIALFWTAIEPIFPVLASFVVNMAIVSIAANEVTGESADTVGNTDFKNYLTRTGQIMWGIALLAAAQSSAITTTYTGQYIMDGFLQIRIALWKRAVLTRCVALIPCVVIAAVMDGNALNKTVNLVNALLGVLLPFALTPLVKFSTSKQFLGEHAPGTVETVILWFAAFAVYALNAFGLSAKGGGFFGDAEMNVTWLGILVQIVYFAWNAYIVWMPIKPMRDFTDPRPIEKSFGVVQVNEEPNLT